MKQDNRKTRPGFHKSFLQHTFGEDEKKIIKKLSVEWYLTNSGKEIKLASTSVYKYFLARPTEIFSEMFNIEREIIFVFSPYENFETRTLDAFDWAKNHYEDLRVENICRILISKDSDVENKISELIKTDPEQPIVVPFSYDELLNQYDDYFIRNRFRKHFYTRDLFAFLSPLTKDLYFFGRSELVHDIVNRHRAHEHTGLFGLRKSGKTSIIYAIERLLEVNDQDFLSIDCEKPSIHMLRWNELLYCLANLLKEKKNSKYKISDASEYSPINAADLFEKDVIGIYKSKKKKSVLLIFDEIERISPKTGSSLHWRDGDDFVYFWQTLRAFYQRYPEIFSYMIVGTNPHCVECPTFGIHDNPIFSSIPFQYVPSFDVPKTRQMVRKLGRYMGLKFDEIIYSKLTEDFGGHPFLIRQVCSIINALGKGDRPTIVDKALYNKAKTDFLLHSKQYVEMIVQILQEWYPDEYDMLLFLANKDLETFNEFAQEGNYYTNHLIGYGLLNASQNGFTFNIECIKDYLITKHRHSKKNLTAEEKLTEIFERRTKLEKCLRKILRNQLKSVHGKNIGSQKVLNSLSEERRKKLSGYSIEMLLDPGNSPLYFSDLISIVKREWDIFKNIFEISKSKLIIYLDEINALRVDAHANQIKEDEFTQLRLHFNKLENIVADWC